MARIFIVNVGVNTDYEQDYGLRSPLFSDGTFEFIPILERREVTGDIIPTYKDIKCHNSDNVLADYLPLETHTNKVHNDPEFITYTYGDITGNSRSVNLTSIQQKDYIFFLARLIPYQDSVFNPIKAGFYFIGFFFVENLFLSNQQILKNLTLLQNNAHIKRYKVRYGNFGDFFIIKGSKEESKRFKYAVRVNKDFCDKVLRDKERKMFNWANGTINKRIGSYTRTARDFIDENKTPSLWSKFWRIIDK